MSVAQRARALRASGEDVIGFTLGEPDFDTPAVIKRSAIEALEAGRTKYEATLGDAATREAICEKLTRENGIPGLTREHVGVSAGAKQALYVLLHCLFDPPAEGGEAMELLLPTPTWVSYEAIAELAGARVRHLATTREEGFRISPSRLDEAIDERTRLIILCTPSNPCGTVYSEADLRSIADVIVEACRTRAPGLMVLVDEIYEKLVYGEAAHFSLGSIPEISERVITINGLSKAYAMTGWRAGYCACPGAFGLELMRAMATLQGQISTNVTSFVLAAISTALREAGEEVERMRRAFSSRAERMHARLREIDGLEANPTQGAIYAFCDVSACFGRRSAGGREITSALNFSEALLEEQKVAVIPGEDFGPPGERYIRLSFACSEETIDRGLDRLDAFVRSLR